MTTNDDKETSVNDHTEIVTEGEMGSLESAYSIPTLAVRWKGPFFNPSGYASEAINFVLPLADRINLGIKNHNNLYSEKFVSGLPEKERDTLLKLQSACSKLTGGIAISHNPANGFSLTSNADYNIGRTMFETDRIPKSWVKFCNKMDEIWVPSQFNRDTFAASGVEPDKLVVIPGAVNEEEFDPERHQPLPLPNRAKFNFFSMYEWIWRKGWDVFLAAYLQEFSTEDDVCLYLRTYLLSQPDGDPKEILCRKIKNYAQTLNLGDKPLPRIEILADQIPLPDLPRLYKAMDCLVAPSRGEGWGRPQHEAMMMGLPVIATNWSGNTAFMNHENSYLLDYEMTEVKNIEPVFWHYKGHCWANPSIDQLQRIMRQVEQNQDAAARIGQQARVEMIQHFGRSAVSRKVLSRLSQIEQKLSTPACPAVVARSLDIDTQETPDNKYTVSVAWEGSFLDYGSLSHVNRELSSQLTKKQNINLSRVSKNNLPKHLSNIPQLQKLARQLKVEAPSKTDVTIRHSWPPNFEQPASPSWILMQPWEFGALPEDWINAVVNVDEIWAYTHYVRRVYIDSGIDPDKVQVVPLGIDPDRFHPDIDPLPIETAKSFKFLFVGGTIHRKGPDLLLKAYLENFNITDDVCLVIKDFGGQSAYAGKTFEAQIHAAQSDLTAPEIIYLNQEISSEDMVRLYTACDVLVHPYRGEGFGLPVLEAMACGLPVIVTGGGSTDDFADDDHAYRLPSVRHSIGSEVDGFSLTRNGWLLEPSLVALSSQMKWIYHNQHAAKAKGRKASDYVRLKWTWKRAAEIARLRIQVIAKRTEAKMVATRTRRSRKAPAIVLPSCAKIGSLDQSRSYLKQRKHLDAWHATLEAIQVRPFHPEAYLLLAEIAQTAGDAPQAQLCARRSKQLVPRWKATRRYLKSKSDKKLNSKRSWPALPEINRTPSLSVCLITRNEEKHLPSCLRSIQGLAAQIVVVDTGSSDRTVEIAQSFGAEIYSFPWRDDFSAARNASLERATSDWILILDADEELSGDQHEILKREIRNPGAMAYRLPIIDCGKEDEGHSYVPRLFRNAPGLFYVGRIHEQVLSSVEARRQEWRLDHLLGTATIHHHGYTADIIKSRDKVARNLKLLEQAIEEFPNEPHLLMNFGLELARSGHLEAGLEQYLEAYEVMSSLPPQQVVPELRESLLTQFCSFLMNSDQFKQIIEILVSPLANSKDLTASMQFMLGVSYSKFKNFDAAIQPFKQCIARRNEKTLSPYVKAIHQAGPNHCLAIALSETKQWEQAEKAFQEAIIDDPTSIPVRLEFADFLNKTSKPVEALTQLHLLIKEDPKQLHAWILGGKICLNHPDLVEFLIDWSIEAHKYYPDHMIISRMHAEALLLAQQIEPSRSIWKRLVSADPTPTHLAALCLCNFISNQTNCIIHKNQERAVSQAFVHWYRRLITYKAANVIERINQDLIGLGRLLPTAAGLLQSALSHENLK